MKDRADGIPMLSELYIRRRDSLLRQLIRIVRNRQTAEDLVQEAYIRVRAALEAGTVAHPDAFLRQTALNLARDHERRNARRKRLEAGVPDDSDAAAPSSENQLIERERVDAFRAALSQLPPRARQVWALCYGGERTYAEAADILGVSRNTVYNDMKLAVGHCHDAMKTFEGR